MGRSCVKCSYLEKTNKQKQQQKTPKGHRETLGGVVLEVSVTLIVMTVSQVCAYVQTYQNVHIKYMQFFVYQFCL